MWAGVVAALVLGYLLLGRPFAYIGVPAAGIFIGEASLALFAVARPRALVGRWAGALVKSTPLAPLGWSLLALVSFGLFEAARGVAAGYPVARVMQTFVFSAYPLFFFLGVHVGLQKPELLDRLLRALGWASGIWGVAYVLWLNRLAWRLPHAPDVQMLGIGGGASVALVALITSAAPLRRSAIPLVLNAVTVAGMLVRARWFGVAAAFAATGVVRGRLQRAAGVALAGVAILGCAYVLDVKVPAPARRGGSFSAREVVARLLAITDAEEAASLGTSTAGSSRTVSWRFELWSAVWSDVHGSAASALVGWGYGRSLNEVVPFVQANLRSPHNSFLFALGYTGWIGVVTFLVFQLALVGLMWRAFRVTGNAFGIGCWVLHMVVALFGNVLETPFNAIPFYLLAGLAAAPALGRHGDAYADPARP